MAVGESETGRSVMVRGRLVNPMGGLWVEKTSVVNAAGMLVEIDPSISRTGKNEIRTFFDVFVDSIPRPGFRIAVAYAYVTGNAPYSFFPALGPLLLREVFIRRTFVNVFGVRKIRRKLRVFWLD